MSAKSHDKRSLIVAMESGTKVVLVLLPCAERLLNQLQRDFLEHLGFVLFQHFCVKQKIVFRSMIIVHRRTTFQKTYLKSIFRFWTHFHQLRIFLYDSNSRADTLLYNHQLHEMIKNTNLHLLLFENPILDKN